MLLVILRTYSSKVWLTMPGGAHFFTAKDYSVFHNITPQPTEFFLRKDKHLWAVAISTRTLLLCHGYLLEHQLYFKLQLDTNI